MRAQVAGLAAVLLAAVGCGEVADPELEPGVPAPAAVEEPSEALPGGRWSVLVRLREHRVDGHDLVLAEFEADALACPSGEPGDPSALAPGDRVEVERADRFEAARANPPTVRVARLTADCP